MLGKLLVFLVLACSCFFKFACWAVYLEFPCYFCSVLQTALVKLLFHYICHLQNHTVKKQNWNLCQEIFLALLLSCRCWKAVLWWEREEGAVFSTFVNTPGSQRLQYCLLWPLSAVHLSVCDTCLCWHWCYWVPSYQDKKSKVFSLHLC